MVLSVSDATTTIGIFISVILFVLSLLVGVVVWVFIDFRSEMRETMKTTDRHVQGIMTSVWGNTWRTDNIETFLDDTTDYRPVRPPIPPHDP